MERYLHINTLLALCIFTSYSPWINAADASLAQCQSYQKKIEYYTALRRKGSTAKNMEKWRQKRKDYKNRFSEKNCRQWASKLDEP